MDVFEFVAVDAADEVVELLAVDDELVDLDGAALARALDVGSGVGVPDGVEPYEFPCELPCPFPLLSAFIRLFAWERRAWTPGKEWSFCDLSRNLTARAYCPLRRASAPISRQRSACSLFTFDVSNVE